MLCSTSTGTASAMSSVVDVVDVIDVIDVVDEAMKETSAALGRFEELHAARGRCFLTCTFAQKSGPKTPRQARRVEARQSRSAASRPASSRSAASRQQRLLHRAVAMHGR